MTLSQGFLDSMELSAFLLVPDKPDMAVQWYDAAGEITDDHALVAEKRDVTIPRFKKPAESEDFQYIYQREFTRTGLADTAMSHDIFKGKLTQKINEMISRHTDNRSYETVDFPLIAAAKQFVEFINLASNLSLVPDHTYLLTAEFRKDGFFKSMFESFKRQIDSYGKFEILEEYDAFRIYHPGMAVILTTDDLPVKAQATKNAEIINGANYIERYIEGYKAGRRYFEQEFSISVSNLYSEFGPVYIKNIHNHFFHLEEYLPNHFGWSFVKKMYPLLFNGKTIYDYGYYAGLTEKVEQLAQRHFELFDKYDVCDQQKRDELIEAKMSGQSANVPDPKTNAEVLLAQQQRALKYLAVFKGRWSKQAILSKEEFERLIVYVNLLLSEGTLPEKVPIQPFRAGSLPLEFIRKTFYNLHQEFYGRKVRPNWITFMHKVFSRFKDTTESTTRKLFSTYRGNYEQDYKNIMDDLYER